MLILTFFKVFLQRFPGNLYLTAGMGKLTLYLFQGTFFFEMSLEKSTLYLCSGPNIQLPFDGSGYVLEYAVRSYAGFTGAYVGDKDNPKIKVSFQAPVIDYTTSAGVVIRNGNVSVTGSILGQGGTFTAGESGIAFQGTLGNVTVDTAIGKDGLKFYATTADALLILVEDLKQICNWHHLVRIFCTS